MRAKLLRSSTCWKSDSGGDAELSRALASPEEQPLTQPTEILRQNGKSTAAFGRYHASA
jgi:hypothetical protein